MTSTIAKAIAKAKARLYPESPPVPKTWAFWKYGQFPYFQSGEVKEQLSNGDVRVGSYTGMTFKPFYMATGQHGEDLHKLGKRLRAAYDIHAECSRNAAGNYADEVLTAAGLPTASLGLKRTGWQGDAYKELFRKQVEQER